MQRNNAYAHTYAHIQAQFISIINKNSEEFVSSVLRFIVYLQPVLS